MGTDKNKYVTVRGHVLTNVSRSLASNKKLYSRFGFSARPVVSPCNEPVAAAGSRCVATEVALHKTIVLLDFALISLTESQLLHDPFWDEMGRTPSGGSGCAVCVHPECVFACVEAVGV